MNNRYEDRVHKFNAEQLVLGMQRMPGVLRGLGYSSLREGQQKIISCVMGGQDTLGVLPTSEGKTLSFVAPTLALKWRTLVFSPLISLIRDQQQQYTIRGARVGALTSHNSDAMNMEFLSQWVRGGMDLMYVAPERLMRPEFQEAMRIAPPHMAVVDECFTPDVEILAEDGWVRFDRLEKGRKVAQVDPVDRGITFTVPTEYIQKPHKGRMVHVKSHRLCDLTMTPEHELLVQWPSGWRKQPVDKVRFNSTKKMAAAGFGKGSGSARLTPRERLLIAYQADGNLHRDRSASGMSTLAFSFTRERKIVRFLQLMEDGGFDWSEVADRDGRRRFLVKNVPTVTKRLSDHFKLEDMSVARARAFVAEAVEWDGSKISKKLHYYSCTVKPNTDFVQAVCVLAGYKTNEVMQEDNREPQFNDVYRLFISLETSTFGTGQLEKYDEMYDGDVYCVRVPKGCIVVRRNGKPVIIGNCHCLSGWSDTFRSAYCVIGDFITAFNPQVVLALTATCPPQVEADVRRVLCIQQGVKVLHYPRRKNLDLRSSAWNGLEGLASLLSRKPVEGAAVVYCATQKGTEMTAAALQEMMAKEVLFYHGGLTPASRSSIQDRFMNESDVIMCATNAFGMGVDKPDVRMVVHKDMAGSIEAQAQEEGRGGRDGKYTLCHTFSDPESVRTHKFLIACSNPTFEDVSRVYHALVKNKDLDGKVMLTKDELAKRAGLKGFGVDAVLQVLKGAQVIESTKNERKEHLVRVKNMTDDPKLKDFMAAVRSCAVPASDNGYSFVLQDLEDLLGVSEAVLKSRMRDWAKGGLIQHAPPERTNPVKVVGSLRQVDAERVDGLRARAEAKLAVVRKYVDEVPDNEKHAFIEQCMGVT